MQSVKRTGTSANCRDTSLWYVVCHGQAFAGLHVFPADPDRSISFIPWLQALWQPCMGKPLYGRCTFLLLHKACPGELAGPASSMFDNPCAARKWRICLKICLKCMPGSLCLQGLVECLHVCFRVCRQNIRIVLMLLIRTLTTLA